MDNIIKNIDYEIKNFLQFHNTLYFSILGGEPLAEYNKQITFEISKYIKNTYQNATNVLYSWRTIDNIKQENLKSFLTYIDYGVLGSYNKELHIANTIPSSVNQYIFDFKNNKTIPPINLKY